MGQHHRRELTVVTPALVPAPGFRPVPHDAPPAGLGYPAPTAYRPHPVTGVPTPPHGAPAARTTRIAPRTASRAGTRAPLAVAVAGAAIALIGVGSQIPSLVDAVTTTAASAPGAPGTTAAPATPAVAHQCATVVAVALDDTVSSLGRTPSSRWTGVVDARADAVAATYGAGSPEQRAYEAGADDILGWLNDGSTEDYGTVTSRVAQTVATACGS